MILRDIWEGHTLYCAVNYEKVSTGENSVRHFF